MSPAPGTYATTVTRPDLFRNYLIQQIELLIQNHGVSVDIGPSDTPMPVHFAVAGSAGLSVPQEGVMDFSLRDVFDVPDLATTNDDIVNGMHDALCRRVGPAGPVHRAAGGLLAGPAVALHRDRPDAFPEPCPVHQLPVLRG